MIYFTLHFLRRCRGAALERYDNSFGIHIIYLFGIFTRLFWQIDGGEEIRRKVRTCAFVTTGISKLIYLLKKALLD